MTLSIHHDPRCLKSRRTLRLPREDGVESEIAADPTTAARGRAETALSPAAAAAIQ